MTSVLATVLAGFILLVVLGFALYVIFNQAHPEHRIMTIAEEARYELHPTLLSQPTELTADNVNDIVNDTIESGILHPALARMRS
jgi:hypothetical protein